MGTDCFAVRQLENRAAWPKFGFGSGDSATATQLTHCQLTNRSRDQLWCASAAARADIASSHAYSASSTAACAKSIASSAYDRAISASASAASASNCSFFSLTLARTFATWACHLPRISCQCDDALSRAPSALDLTDRQLPLPILCAGGVGSKLIPGVLTGHAQMLCRRLCLLGNLLELSAQIWVCHQDSLIVLRRAHRQPFLLLAASRPPEVIVGAWLPPGIVRPDMIIEWRLVASISATGQPASSAPECARVTGVVSGHKSRRACTVVGHRRLCPMVFALADLRRSVRWLSNWPRTGRRPVQPGICKRSVTWSASRTRDWDLRHSCLD